MLKYGKITWTKSFRLISCSVIFPPPILYISYNSIFDNNDISLYKAYGEDIILLVGLTINRADPGCGHEISEDSMHRVMCQRRNNVIQLNWRKGVQIAHYTKVAMLEFAWVVWHVFSHPPSPSPQYELYMNVKSFHLWRLSVTQWVNNLYTPTNLEFLNLFWYNVLLHSPAHTWPRLCSSPYWI